MTYKIRSIKKSEIPLAQALYRNTFRITSEIAKSWTSRWTDLNTIRVIADDSRILSIAIIAPFEVWVGGKVMSMGGITGVSTWADQQGNGFAGSIIRQCITDMRKQGYALSVLYPFSYPFYGRFGYVQSYDFITYSVKQSDFARANKDPALKVRVADLKKDMPKIKKLYDAASPQWNCMLKRDKQRWDFWRDYWSEDRRHIYIWESAETNQPLGIIGIEDIPLPEVGFEARVPFTLFMPRFDVSQLGAFLGKLPPTVKSIKLIAPRKPGWWSLFKEPSVATTLHASMQARVIDIKRACEMRGYPADINVEVSFAITDECAPENNGPWNLKIRAGKGKLTRHRGSDNVPKLSIQDFTAMFTGYQNPLELSQVYKGCEKELRTFQDAFSDRDARILDFF